MACNGFYNCKITKKVLNHKALSEIFFFFLPILLIIGHVISPNM